TGLDRSSPEPDLAPTLAPAPAHALAQERERQRDRSRGKTSQREGRDSRRGRPHPELPCNTRRARHGAARGDEVRTTVLHRRATWGYSGEKGKVPGYGSADAATRPVPVGRAPAVVGVGGEARAAPIRVRSGAAWRRRPPPRSPQFHAPWEACTPAPPRRQAAALPQPRPTFHVARPVWGPRGAALSPRTQSLIETVVRGGWRLTAQAYSFRPGRATSFLHPSVFGGSVPPARTAHRTTPEAKTMSSPTPSTLDRRAFLAYFSSVGLGGTLLPGVLWAQAQQ